jgi:hypothetical protein
MQKFSNRQLLIAFIVLFAINLSLIGYHTSQYGIAEGNPPPGVVSPQLVAIAVIGMALMILALCFIASAVIAFFINREMPYKTRLIRTFLLIAALSNGLMVIKVLIDSIFGL